jgi:hypothetical protein
VVNESTPLTCTLCVTQLSPHNKIRTAVASLRRWLTLPLADTSVG